MAISFDPSILSDISSNFDAYYTTFGKMCSLVYESESTICPNCIIDTSTGESTNKYNGTGVRPFASGICPVCNGTGRVPATQQFITVKMYLDWDIRRWMNAWGARVASDIQKNQVIRMPGGVVTTVGWIQDLPNILKCDYCIMDIISQSSTDNRFKLSGAPLDSRIITPHRYFTAFWERLE